MKLFVIHLLKIDKNQFIFKYTQFIIGAIHIPRGQFRGGGW